MKKLIPLFALLTCNSVFAVEVGDVIQIPLSAIACVDRTVSRPCFCEPPQKINIHNAEIMVNQNIGGVQKLTGSVGFKTCAEVLSALSSGPDILSTVTLKQVTERLNVPTKLTLTLSLGQVTSVTGSVDSN